MLDILNYKEMDYYLYKPDDFNESNKYPLIVFLHGAGEREKIEHTIWHGPINSIKKGMKINAVILAPHCAKDDLWMNYYERVDELVDIYRNKKYIDIDRVSLTGLSMGGYASFDVAMMHQEYYSCLMPVCGGGKPFARYYLINLKIKIVHGDKDSIVDVSESIKMYNALKEIGADVELVIHEGFDHNVWDITYDDVSNISWLIGTKKEH